MPVEPSGTLSLAQEALRLMLADCPTFRTLVGAADRAAALEHVYHEGLPNPADRPVHTLDELQTYRPYAIVYTAEENGLRLAREAAAGGTHFGVEGSLRVRLVRDVADDADDAPGGTTDVEWQSLYRAVMNDLADLAGTPNQSEYLALRSIAVDEPPDRAHPDLVATQGRWQDVCLACEWG